jgi:hypothetical protein
MKTTRSSGRVVGFRRWPWSRLWLALCASALFAAGCGKGGGGGSGGGGGESDTPDSLKAVVDGVVKASEAGDVKKAAAMTRGLLPDAAAIKKALRDDAPPDFVKQLDDMIASVPKDDAKVATLFRRGEPSRTQINVWGATTEEIKTYAEGGVAYKEFPGGARRLAEQALRPGVKFYEVELVEPGKEDGMKYHLFFWDGSRWRMLGPAWRGLK